MRLRQLNMKRDFKNFNLIFLLLLQEFGGEANCKKWSHAPNHSNSCTHNSTKQPHKPNLPSWIRFRGFHSRVIYDDTPHKQVHHSIEIYPPYTLNLAKALAPGYLFVWCKSLPFGSWNSGSLGKGFCQVQGVGVTWQVSDWESLLGSVAISGSDSAPA